MNTMDTEVLIVGAGPTGLMLANQLARQGVRALIIDRHSGPAQETRAMGVQARTLEIYAKLGIADEALELGRRGNGMNMWANGRRMARIPVGEIGKDLSAFPYVLLLGQDDNERIMGARLHTLGVDVQWNTELVAFEQHPDHVDVTLKQPDGTLRRLNAAWVAGCDGAKSPVREMCGIGFPGAPYEQVFFVADTEATGRMVPDELNVYLWRDGFHLLFPMRGKDRWRAIGILPKHLRDRDDITFAELAPSIQSEVGMDLAFKSCSWLSTYRIHHRAAERFRDRRCFLLGDAAHIHSPAGGQGMNTGIQDAYNLAWKLALVVKGDADATLLDTYEQERIPVARRLLGTTDRAFTMLVSDGAVARLLRTRIIARLAAFAMTFERARLFVFRTLSQIGIRYRSSPLSRSLGGLPERAPRAGDRFPWLKLKLDPQGAPTDLFQALDDTKFNLLAIGQAAAADVAGEFSGLVRTVVVPDDAGNARTLARAGIAGPAFYLLRPDGHVGLAGTTLQSDALRRYFADAHLRREAAAPRTVALDLRMA